MFITMDNYPQIIQHDITYSLCKCTIYLQMKTLTPGGVSRDEHSRLGLEPGKKNSNAHLEA